MIFWHRDEEETRLDIFLAQNLNISRNQILPLIAQNRVSINNKIAKKGGIKLHFGDKIEVEAEDSRDSHESGDSLKNYDSHKSPILAPISNAPIARKSDIFIERIFEDSDILVLNKPPFLATHGAISLKEESLTDWLKANKIQLSTISGEKREGIVHRLDKQTSGALVVAKNNATHSFLSAQLANKTMGRIYLAIIDSPLREDIEVECYLARNPKNRLKMAKFVLKDSRDSRYILDSHSKDSRDSRLDSRRDSYLDSPIIPRFARYSKSKFTKLLLSKDGKFELISARLFTGRTHQIRAHLESLNRHIVGDSLYGYKGDFSAIFKQDSRQSREFPQMRVMLHSYILHLFHPKNAKMSFRAPLFDDMKRVLWAKFDMEQVNEILCNLC